MKVINVYNDSCSYLYFKVVEAIANAIASTEGCSLLDVDPGVSTNRTVYTFVGTPDAVVEGAMNAARVAYQTIDMRRHKGEHPRMGAMDVCPFIPVQNVTMEDCVECAKELAERLSMELGVPVYLYGEASTEEHRKLLPQVRAGEYEGLPEKPGKLKNVQAIGWYLEEANIAQVSVNITDFEVTPIHVVYEEVLKEAAELNLAVVGSQVVGLIPLRAVMQAADFYMEQSNLFLLEEDQKLRLVINKYMTSEDVEGPLVSMDVRDFILTVGSRSPSPGGGSVAALSASLLALKLPHKTEEEKQLREEAMQEGLQTAITVPLTVARITNTLWPTLKELAQIGNINCKSDMQIKEEIETALKTAQTECAEILQILESRKQ
ncbi:hypothetical protein KUTeg_008644 [Tegillarca granosa]|uniref:glutamate formimidoyltransferase n=1 Tax=Tegillarca granosa TaxID=220873 RepID=A0ABQ9FEI8_TEGGR|nr:hypothetical protein KUTeg_008644 [Tegillarca granosa]